MTDSADAGVRIAELQALPLLGTESIDRFLPEVAVLAARTLGEGNAAQIPRRGCNSSSLCLE